MISDENLTAEEKFSLTKNDIYETIVDIRADITKAKIPNDSRCYLFVTPDTMSLMWNDTTANLAMLAGHPRFTTRVDK